MKKGGGADGQTDVQYRVVNDAINAIFVSTAFRMETLNESQELAIQVRLILCRSHP